MGKTRTGAAVQCGPLLILRGLDGPGVPVAADFRLLSARTSNPSRDRGLGHRSSTGIRAILEKQ